MTCDVGHVNSHGMATQANELAEAKAIHAVFSTHRPVGAATNIAALLEQRIPSVAGVSAVDPQIAIDLVTGASRPEPQWRRRTPMPFTMTG